jgi:hypothetical protein
MMPPASFFVGPYFSSRRAISLKVSGNVSELNSQGKGLPMESDSELRVDELATDGGEGYKYQCAFNRANSDLMQFWEDIFFLGQKVSKMDF